MLFADIHPHDIINKDLRQMALNAAEEGEASAAWHGADAFTGEEVEIYLNLTRKIFGFALGDKAFSGALGEKGSLIVLHFKNPARGMVEFNHQSERLEMNLERTGIEVHNDGAVAHLRLFDKLTGQDILQVDDDQFHALVDEGKLDPKSYHVTAFKYAQETGAL